MNEEEKQAIKDTKDILKELNKHIDKDFIGRLYYKNKPIEDILQILLGLIEKQQKEIKVLELDLHEMTISNNHKKVNWVPKEVLNSYIRKDKIKEKIEEYKKICDECNFNKTGICKELKEHYNCSIQSVLELLNELIGE